MKINITSRFIDSRTSRLFAPGEYDLPPATARRFQAEGKGRVVDADMANAIDAALVAVGTAFEEPDINKVVPIKKTDPGTLADEKTTESTDDAETSDEDTDATGDEADAAATKTSSGTALPADFPERETLITNGFDSIESLSVKGVDVELTKIGLTKGKVNKIGQALNKLKG